MLNYSVVIVGAGPGGIYAAYELSKKKNFRIAIIDSGKPLEKRKCPLNNGASSCAGCRSCSIMQGFGGAGAFSDGKYNITNDFGGNLYNFIGKDETMKLLREVDEINCSILDNDVPKLYYSANNEIKNMCLKNDLHLLKAEVRHLGTDKNYILLKRFYDELSENPNIDFYFNTEVESIQYENSSYIVKTKNDTFSSVFCIVATGRSGSEWTEKMCGELNIPIKSNSVDIGVRVELPYETFSHLTDSLYESKIVYRTSKYQDLVRTFCMNPKGSVVSEVSNKIMTVNGHSYEDEKYHTENTNFALLVSKSFTEPFNDSNRYGKYIASLSNMLGDGIIVQRFGDLIRNQRSNEKRIQESFVKPTLKATPGDLSLVLPKRILDDIIEMIYALDKIAPGTASDDTLLYGVEVKFYNMKVDVDEHLQAKGYDGLFIIGDCSGVTHSLSHASASGLFVGKYINKIIYDEV